MGFAFRISDRNDVFVAKSKAVLNMMVVDPTLREVDPKRRVIDPMLEEVDPKRG